MVFKTKSVLLNIKIEYYTKYHTYFNVMTIYVRMTNIQMIFLYGNCNIERVLTSIPGLSRKSAIISDWSVHNFEFFSPLSSHTHIIKITKDYTV